MSSTLLLADDSLTIQKVVELTFADTDFEVIAVSSGEELLRRIPECRPDIIVCDVIMPGKDGYQVCQDVKSNPDTLHIPVILLSGTFEPFDRDRALAAGCSEVITKPFEARKLVETVERLVQGENGPEEPPADEAPGGFQHSWEAADGGGFQPLETYSGDDDLDFGTRLSPSGPEPEPGLEQGESFGVPDEMPPAAEEPPAPVEEPQLAPDEFPEVELGAADLDAEVEPTTAPDLGDDFAFGEPPPPFDGGEVDVEAAEPTPDEDELAERDAAEASAALEWAPPEEPDEWREPADEPQAEAAPAPVDARFAPPPAPAPGEQRAYAVVSGPGEADDPFAADEAAGQPELDTGPVAAPPTAPEPTAPITALSDAEVERIARRVLELAAGTVERIAWEVIPDMAELVVRERVRELEAEVESRDRDDLQ